MVAKGSGALQPGDLIDDTYRIVRRIGEGGMGEVYEATHARLAGRYAIKVLLREIAQDPSLLARFSREAQVTSSLRHPNIVNVLDFRQTAAGTHYIVMEYLEGRDLAAELQRAGALPLPRVVDIVDQIASGLAAAHEQGIVHRDLKPPNLFLVVLPGTGRELVKIVDFGISKVRRATAQLTRTATVMGTPQYMSPEQALGQIDRIDARSDQFSLAAIVYEMISGSCPFVGESLPTLMYQLVHVDPVPLTALGLRVAPALDAVVQRGLAKQQEVRFANVLEFAQAFARAAAGQPMPAPAGVSAVAAAPAGPATARGVEGPAATPSAAAVVGAEGRTLPFAPEPPAGPARPGAAVATTLRSTAGESMVRPRAGGAWPRSRTAAVGAGMITAAAVVAAGLWFWSGRSSEPETGPAPEASGAAARAPGGARLQPPAAPSPPAASSEPAPPPVRPAGVAIPDELAPRAAIHAEVTVEVQDAPVGLLVSVDGSEPGPLPIRLQKGSGQHRLVFQAPGHRSRTMKLDATRDLSLVLSLAKLPDAPGAKGAKGGKGSTSPPPAAAPSITKKSNAFTDL